MQCFIGIVPPPNLSEAIRHIQLQYGDNRTEPHITLRPPMMIAENEKWLNAIREIASSFPPLTITLPCTGMFGTRVLFIEVEGSDLYKLEKALVPVIKPFEKDSSYTDQPYHAHLTLGRLNVGFTTKALQDMRQLADDMLKEPVEFIAGFIRIYFKPSIAERYRMLEDIAFGK